MKGVMLAFLGDPKVKRKYLARVRAHRKADEIIHGQYWVNGKGCAVGCTVHSADHSAYEREIGIPRIIARLEDGIFEALPNRRSLEWPEQVLSAIKPGADLSLVWPQFAVWMLADPKWGVLQFARSEQSKKAISDVAEAYRGVTSWPTQGIDWRSLRSAAYAAYAYDDAAAYAAASGAYAAASAAYAAYDAATAYATAYAATYDAAYAASSAATYAATYAAASAADDDARAGARNRWRVAQAEKLLELLAAVPRTRKSKAA